MFTYGKSYNPFIGFLYGWSFFAVIQTGTIAAVAVAFAKFTGYFIPSLNMVDKNIFFRSYYNYHFKLYPAQLVAIGINSFTDLINTRGIKTGKIIQTTFTVSKLLALFGLILFGFLLVKESFWHQNWQNSFHAMKDLGSKDVNGVLQPTQWTDIFGMAVVGAVAASMTGSVFQQRCLEQCDFYCRRN